jgi:hypothetical protein
MLYYAASWQMFTRGVRKPTYKKGGSTYFISTDDDTNYTFISSNLNKANFETFADHLQTTIFTFI